LKEAENLNAGSVVWNREFPLSVAVGQEKMQAKDSTTEGRHDGIGMPSSPRPFAVVKKNNKQRKNKSYDQIIQPIRRASAPDENQNLN
jgi:hypothetical protein